MHSHWLRCAFKVMAIMSQITIKLRLSGIVQHTPVPQPRRIKEKVDYIILKGSPIRPHFIKTLAVKAYIHHCGFMRQ